MSGSASNSTPNPQLHTDLDLSTTFGPFLIGNTIGVMFFGISLIQVVWYYTHYPKDHILLKIWVATLVCLGAVHELITFLGIYRILIPRFGDIAFILEIFPVLMYQIMVTTVVGVMVQCFFIHRIVTFANNVFIKYGIPALLSPLILWQLAGSSIYVHEGLGFKSALQLNSLLELTVSVAGTQCTADVVIALTMSILLYTQKTGVKATDQVLRSLIIASINTGTWTAILAIAVVIAFCIEPAFELIYACPYLMLSSIYINTVLSNLNIRQFLRDRRAGDSNENAANLRLMRRNLTGFTDKGDMPIISVEQVITPDDATLNLDMAGRTESISDHEYIHHRV